MGMGALLVMTAETHFTTSNAHFNYLVLCIHLLSIHTFNMLKVGKYKNISYLMFTLKILI